MAFNKNIKYVSHTHIWGKLNKGQASKHLKFLIINVKFKKYNFKNKQDLVKR